LINEGAKAEGDIVAEELTISGQVKGTIHANRVELNSTAVVEGDIFHRSLSIEENARFEGSSKRKTRLSMRREPHLGAQRPRTICKQGSPQSNAMGNPMGHETRTRMLTRELLNA
jgi:cytoskeletal protein CcmA (bactofilin family)